MDSFHFDGGSYVRKKHYEISPEKRREVLEKTGNCFANFPSIYLKMDLLSDSGVCALNQQISMALALGDEAYSRSSWYYALYDTMRDMTDRGDSPKKAYRALLNSPIDIDEVTSQLILPEIPKDSFIGD